MLAPFLKKAAEQEAKNNISGALQAYNGGIAANPKDPVGYYQRGLLYMGKMANWTSSIESFSKVIELSPNFSMAYCYRGSCYVNLQNLQAADTDLQRAIFLDSANVLAYLNLATTLRLQGNLAGAERVVSLGIKRRRDWVNLFIERAEIYYRSNKFAETLADCQEILRLQRDNLRALTMSASVKIYLRDFQGAVNDYTGLIKRTGYSKEYYFGRADAYRGLKMYDKSLDDLRYIMQQPSAEDRLLAQAICIENFGNMMQYQEAKNEATKFLQQNPRDKSFFANILGQININTRQDKFYNQTIYTMRGLARLAMTDTTGARSDWEKAKILGMKRAENFLQTNPASLTRPFIPDVSFPQNLQFYPRASNNEALIPIRGYLTLPGFDSVYCEIWANGKIQQRQTHSLNYEGGLARANFQVTLRAALQEYELRIGAESKERDTIVCRREGLVCGDVIVLSGQSNIVYGSLDSLSNSRFIRTFFMGSNDELWWRPSGNKARESSIGAVGLTLADELIRTQGVPVCVLNFGIEGTIIEAHLPDAANPANPGTWFGRTLWHLRESRVAGAVKAFVWYQGESNSENSESPRYGEKFMALHQVLKAEMPALQKTYLVQIRPSQCVNTDGHALLREEQRKLGLQSGFETLASTSLPGYDGCHYNDSGYIALGKRLAGLIQHDIYAKTATPQDTKTGARELPGLSSPSLKRAYWSNAEKKEIIVEFDTADSLVIGAEVVIAGKVRTLTQDAMFLNGKVLSGASVLASGNMLKISFSVPQANSMNAQSTISYAPDKCYADSPQNNCFLYDGPWLKTKSGSHTLTFHNIPIENAP